MKKARGDVKVVILTMHADSAYAAAALDAGASGYVLQACGGIGADHGRPRRTSGETYLSPLIAGDLMQHGKEPGGQQRDIGSSLTPRQREVLQLLAEGHPLKEIASTLNISTRTVEFHKYQMMECLGIKSTAELVRFAVRNRIVAEY